MAETHNIASLAEIVSNDLFARFFWAARGSWNQNWPCENERHRPRKTQPSDVVFYYDEPYSSGHQPGFATRERHRRIESPGPRALGLDKSTFRVFDNNVERG